MSPLQRAHIPIPPDIWQGMWSLKRSSSGKFYFAELDVMYPLSKQPDLFLVKHMGCSVATALRYALGDRVQLERKNNRTRVRQIDNMLSVISHGWHVHIENVGSDHHFDIADYPLLENEVKLYYGPQDFEYCPWNPQGSL